MANVKITDLTELSAADSAAVDVFPIVDIDADATKKITIASLRTTVAAANDFVTFTLLNANVNTASGISTFNRVSAGSTIKTTNLVVGGGSVTRTDSSHVITVNGESTRFFVTDNGAIGISTTTNLEATPDIGIIAPEKIAILGAVGVGTTAVRCAVDFADAGVSGITTDPYFLPPKVSTTTRNGIGATITGATIYNITLNKLKEAGRYNWKTRFGPSCSTRNMSKDSQGYYLLGVEGNILQKINY